MGYAKAAELNGYPGPAHVLHLAEQLGLSEAQQADTEALFSAMKGRARELGAELVAAERRLDRMFRGQEADSAVVSQVVAEIGDLESQLRATHLEAHLRQIEVLSEEQVEDYMRLRGYGDGHPSGHHQHRHGR